MAERKKYTVGLTREAEEKQFELVQGAKARLVEGLKKSIERRKIEYREIDEEFDAEDRQKLGMLRNLKLLMEQDARQLAVESKIASKPYFGRIDIRDPKQKHDETFYIGKSGITGEDARPIVIDWRSPIASVYYENHLGKVEYSVKSEGIQEVDLKRKRSYEIENGKLLDYYDVEVVANDDLLNKYLGRSKKKVLNEIIATIQTEQNRIIRKNPRHNLIVQGAAGSGKTTVAMHRISYILYNYPHLFRPQDFYIIGSNRILLNYITGVLPDLDVDGVSQMTMEQLFTNLLYEDWNVSPGKIRPLTNDPDVTMKGQTAWFEKLRDWCDRYEKSQIPARNVYVKNGGVQLLSKDVVEEVIRERTRLSMEEKIIILNEILMGKLENEIGDKNVLYSEEQKKDLIKLCRYYFGRGEFKGSIYDLYEDFLFERKMEGQEARYERGTYDLYDLAALAFLYRRIKETDGIREASHVVIDEAQDFGMMAYRVLKYCLRSCTYTIMGDVSQNIHPGFGLNDWEELRELMLSEEYDSFSVLRKSYRNTIEISETAVGILEHGRFPIYPIEPIVRHGAPVEIQKCASREALIERTADSIAAFREKGLDTIAVICKDRAEADEVTRALSGYTDVRNCDEATVEFGSGVMVLPIDLTKGLEFDAVVIFDPTEEKYPSGDENVKLLYVAATRALHELKIFHCGPLSAMIAEKADPELAKKYRREVEEDPEILRREEYHQRRMMEPERVYTDRDGMTAREFFTEARIIKDAMKKEYEGPEEKSGTDNTGASKAMQTAAVSSASAKTASTVSVNKSASVKKAPAAERTDLPLNPSKYAFGTMMEPGKMRPKGHGTIDLRVQWIKRNPLSLDIACSYGQLRLTPVSDRILHVQFRKGQDKKIRGNRFDLRPEEKVDMKVRESREQVLLSTKELNVYIDKATGRLTFTDPKNKVLLAEKKTAARQCDGMDNWIYFDWEKKEKLFAKGLATEAFEPLTNRAMYISYGGKRLQLPMVWSDKNYGIAVACETTASCCAIPMYGPYIYMEGDEIDYYFITGPSRADIVTDYKTLSP